MLNVITTKLGPGVGASLAAVDLGLAPISRQIGRAGTPQHMEGVELTIEAMPARLHALGERK